MFRTIGVALSGGRDSLLTLLIAHRYASRVRPDDPGSLLRAFYMPSRYSSAETRRAAETICRELGVPLEIVPIDEAFERELAATEAMLGPGETVTELTRQNIQARIRGQRMWNWSNSSGGLFLQTGNMSEKAVGYTTIGGDLEGALGVLANVPKTVVMALLDYLQEQTGYAGIGLVLAKPAGPELAPDQEGEKELMPFPVLDACFHLFAAEKLLPEEVEEALVVMFPGHTRDQLRAWVEKFTRLFLGSIYKWVQAPISLHIGNLDLDRERALQLPVVQNQEWAAIAKPELEIAPAPVRRCVITPGSGTITRTVTGLTSVAGASEAAAGDGLGATPASPARCSDDDLIAAHLASRTTPPNCRITSRRRTDHRGDRDRERAVWHAHARDRLVHQPASVAVDEEQDSRAIGIGPKIVIDDEQHRRQDPAVGQDLHVPGAQVTRVDSRRRASEC